MSGATSSGTEAFRTYALKRGVDAGHFRELEGLQLSNVGLGTYLGDSDEATDELYREAVVQALELGCNFLDSAINYRCQRSERALGLALRDLAEAGTPRDRIVVCTKGGYIPFDREPPSDPRAYLKERFFDRGILRPEEVVQGHSLAPRFLRDQVETSLRNLGLDALDVYYLHNPESQLASIDRETFLARVRAAFACLEELADDGSLAFYGTATWNGFRVSPGAREYLSLQELVSLAREVAGEGHRFRYVQAPFNLAMTEILSEQNQRVGEASLSLCRAAEALGVHVVASASIAQGRLVSGLPDWLGRLLRGLATDAQRAIHFVRSTPGVAVALVGMKSRQHVLENLEVARIPPAPVEDFLKLFEVRSDEG